MPLNLGYIEGTCADGDVVIRVYYDATQPAGPGQPLIDGPRGYCLDVTNRSGRLARLTVDTGTGAAAVDMTRVTGDAPVGRCRTRGTQRRPLAVRRSTCPSGMIVRVRLGGRVHRTGGRHEACSSATRPFGVTKVFNTACIPWGAGGPAPVDHINLLCGTVRAARRRGFSASGQLVWYVAEVEAGAYDTSGSQNAPTDRDFVLDADGHTDCW